MKKTIALALAAVFIALAVPTFAKEKTGAKKMKETTVTAKDIADYEAKSIFAVGESLSHW